MSEGGLFGSSNGALPSGHHASGNLERRLEAEFTLSRPGKQLKGAYGERRFSAGFLEITKVIFPAMLIANRNRQDREVPGLGDCTAADRTHARHHPRPGSGCANHPAKP